MALKTAKEKLLSFATSLDSEVVGVGQTPPTVKVPKPEGDLILQNKKIKETKQSKGGNPNQEMLNSSFVNLKIDPKRIVPYTTSHIFDYDIPSIKDMLSARKMERQIDDLIMQKTYTITEGSEDADKISKALEDVDLEIEDMDTLLAAVESMNKSLEEADKAFEKEAQERQITENMTANMEELGLDMLGKDENQEPISFLDVLAENSSIPRSSLEEFKNSAIYLQALSDSEYTLSRGLSPSFIIESNQREKSPYDFAVPKKSIKKYSGMTFKTLSQLGIGDNANYDSVFGKNVNGKPPIIDGFSAMEHVAYYCSILSHEYLLSAGLGALVGTPLGQKFGAAGKPLKKLFGTETLLNITGESASPDSLADFVVVGETGNIKTITGKEKRVQLFEGDDPAHNSYKTSKTAWIDTIKTDPLNNKMNIMSDVLNQASDTFSDAEEFLKTMTGRNVELNLLTPRGLFARVLKDFASLLEGLTVSTDAELRGKNAIEIMFLVHCARGTSTKSSELSSLRRRMHIFACRLANLRRLAEESDDPLVRITSTEGSSGFQSGITEVNTDKRQVALSLAPLSTTSEKLTSGTTVTKTGQQIIDSVVDSEDAAGLNSLIVAIFEDLQNEALNLSREGGDNQTYLREGLTTRFSGFDGAMTIAYIFECFTVLADSFCAVQLELDKGMSFVTALYFAVKEMGDIGQEETKLFVDSFLDTKQKIRYHGNSNPNSKLNRARKFLLELSAALENSDLSNLVDSDGNITGVDGLTEIHQIGNGVTITPMSLIELSLTLSQIENLPLENFAVAKSVVQTVVNSTEDLSLRAKALRGDTALVPDDIAILKTLGESQLGKDFINGLTPEQLVYAQKRLTSFKEAKELPYKIETYPDEIFDCIDFLLDTKSGEFVHGAILLLGLPSGTVSSEMLSKSSTRENSSVKFSIDKLDELLSVVDFKPITKTFGLMYDLDNSLIIEAFEQDIVPTNFNELVLLLTYHVVGEDDPILGSEIISLSSNPTQTRRHLEAKVESFLFKKMIEILSDINSQASKIQLNPMTARGEGVLPVLSSLSKPLDLNPDLPNLFFTKTPEGLKLPNAQKVSQMIQPRKVIVKGIDAWKSPVITPFEIDMVYKFFSTKPFFVEKIRESVLTRSIFDEVFAVWVSLDEFDPDGYSSRELFFQSGGTQQTINDLILNIKEARSPDRVAIESLYISADLEVS